MSVYKRGSIWWADYTGPHGRVRESTYATDRRVAERFERKRRKEVADGTWRAQDTGEAVTVGAYAETWIQRQHDRGLSTARDIETRLRLHVLPRIGRRPIEAIRPREVIALVQDLRGTHLAPRSVRHCYEAFRLLMRDAQIDELIIASPCVLPPGTLPEKADRDPAWRSTALLTRGELEQLLSDERIPLDRRTYYALIALAGLRHGEAAGRRWRDYDAVTTPLGMLRVATQASGKQEARPLKTGRPRVVPIHPTLAAILAEWSLHGFGSYFGRSPRPDDWLVPSRRGRYRTVRHTLRRLHEDLERLGMRPRRTHDLRRTFVSLARADGAPGEVLRAITHGPPSDVLDLYTTWPWETLCGAVSCLRVGRCGGSTRTIDVRHNTRHSEETGNESRATFKAKDWRSGRDSKP